MIFDNLFSQNSILETAMQATQYRNKVIINNMANADTPNYKSKSVDFEGVLSDAIKKTKDTGINHMAEVMPRLVVSVKENSTTLDGNSVDIETEMVNLYKNSAKYDTIVGSVISNSNISTTVYNAFK